MKKKDKALCGDVLKNYSRFYTLLTRMSHAGERKEMKDSMVYRYTNGRTTHLKEMTLAEYNGICAVLERVTGHTDELRKLRSRVLKQMQRMGVDTADWTRVNALCEDKRIAGKTFARLKIAELEALSVKLRSIEHRGGLKQKTPTQAPQMPAQSVQVMTVQTGGAGVLS